MRPQIACRTIGKTSFAIMSIVSVASVSGMPAQSVLAMADHHTTLQVFDNLVSNAVKYSQEGQQIWLEVVEQGGRVLVRIRDEGPGFSEEDKARLFGKFARLPSDGVPYPILVFAALLPWQFFSSALSECGNSLVSNSNLISKVYFPRLVVPGSAVITSFVDFLVSAAFLPFLMAFYRFAPGWRICALPLFILLAFTAALGGGLWLAALTVRYRDVRIIIPFIVQFGFFISPVGYGSNVVSEPWRLLYSLNPMVGVIDGFRWSIQAGHQPLYWPGVGLAIASIGALLLSGIWYFRKTERSFADVI